MNLSWLQFNKLNFSPRKQRALLNRFGSPEQVLHANRDALLQVEGITPENCDAIQTIADRSDWSEELAKVESLHVKLLPRDHPDYPELLKQIHDPPPLLFVRGELRSTDYRSIAIVGTRRASTYAKIVAEKLAGDLVRHGVTVVSGLATGVDTASHRGALQGKGRTIAVCGCGLDVVYPRENKQLMEQIVGGGAIVSELPLGTNPEPWHFPARNRIISGLSLGVVVIEAPASSGALITADCALEQGREVFAVPGNVTLNNNRGGHQLLKEGAALVEDVDDILRALNLETQLPAENDSVVTPVPDLAPQEATVLKALGREEKHVDDLTRSAGLTPAETNAALMMLEMKGFARRLPGNMFMRIR